MVAQLPEGALAAAVGVQIYSHICLICCSLMIFLVWKHHERGSYVALFSYATFISILASIAQQLHTIVLWDDIKTTQFYYVHSHIGCPELAIAGPSYGVDLWLFYIQYYCYSVEGILSLFWAFSLAFTLYISSETNQHYHQRIKRKRSVIAKAIAFLLPLAVNGLLRIPAIRKSTAAFITLANFCLASSLLLGSFLLVAILAKYIRTRRRLHRQTARCPFPGGPDSNGVGDGRDSDSEDSIYDGWLLVRFAIALIFIGAFQILTILSEVAQLRNNRKEALPPKPDLSAARARVDFIEFMPGVSAGLLVFLVFGTTRTCRRTLYVTFIPHMFRSGTTSTGNTASSPNPRLEYQGVAFITSPPLVAGSRRTSVSNPPHLGERVSPYARLSCPVLERTGPRISGSKHDGLSEGV
ncbi:hypothetical protein NUW58_g497 [Xylaria curta]|uniref:Uncharacterized protein n=1 Tax=Xylaria curta TaxID=42375 RepID=A0ACC1PRS3_9PEZI|nr:hypothetical protein NUW58_g497 [Xylaria curta]